MSGEDKQKKALEDRGRAAGIEVDRRKSIEDITAEVEAAEKAAADKAAAEKAAAEKAAAEKAAADEAAEAKPKFPYSIAKGKAITTRGGVKSAGQEIKAADLPDGKDGLTRLVKSGHVVKA